MNSDPTLPLSNTVAGRGRRPPRARRSSLITALVSGLLAVAALPFALATYQILLARDSLVDQTQLTHLIAARASADRFATVRGRLSGAVRAAAQNPFLFESPQSAEAGEVLSGMLVGDTQILAAATIYRNEDGEDVLVQLARRPEAEAIEPAQLQALTGEVLFVELAGMRLLGRAEATERPGLRVAMFSSASGLEALLDAQELGTSAELLLVDGDRPHPLSGSGELPPRLQAALARPEVVADAFTQEGANGREINAFARVPGSRWAVVSRQPADEAEVAAASMRRGAIFAAGVVLLMVAALALLAWRRVVKPVRALLEWQHSQVPGERAEGGDLAQLQTAFAQIQRMQRNREAISEVFLGRYKLLSTLGQGAMGSVFLAWDPRLKRHVAIKTIHLDALDAALQEALARTLENEAVAVANLQHPNIVGVYDLIAAGQFAFVVMEYIEGGNLRAVVSRNGALEPGEVVHIGQSMLRALDAAHRAGLLHLDIKPGNVLVPPRGELKLADFGVAAWRSEVPDLVHRGGLSGTPGFIAPEYVAGQPPSERSDLYALGRLLLECLTGIPQHLPGAHTNDLRREAGKPVEFTERLLTEQPALCEQIRLLCSERPEQRPASAEAALVAWESLELGDGPERLAERAEELAEPLDLAGEVEIQDRVDYGGIDPEASTRGPRQTSAGTTRPAPGDGAGTTRPPPDPEATRPPPVYDPDQTRPPPSR
ncbi:serine/threonine-protein kinase [Pseudomarimonas salicorniae]|uniref:Serine/threonine protein kinase n=1 Tax=Pseudomarimonas salicorniae TaxID=2933270 RepID=A0ABT0GJB4_9GAMM|nr:serine/threonine-protein kinase [Lysobacter sp. CAU 1642]MCK7594299.1 serine/threonine protein kinase [Lysobacter sp. CAU 1642]